MVSKQKEISGDLWSYLSSSRARQNCFPQLGRGWESFAGILQGMLTHSKHGSKTVSLAALQDESGKRPRQSSRSIAVDSGDSRLKETGEKTPLFSDPQRIQGGNCVHFKLQLHLAFTLL